MISTPQYISIPLFVQKQKQVVGEPLRVLARRLQTPRRDSQNTSLTLSQTNEKLCSNSTELSNLSTFYQSVEIAPQEIKQFNWQSFRNNCQEMKENMPTEKLSGNVTEKMLTKINQFHMSKFRSNKIQRTAKPNISEVRTPPSRLVTFESETVNKTAMDSGMERSPQTRRKSNQVECEYSYRKSESRSFFGEKQRSMSLRQSTQRQSCDLKQMIDKAISNTKLFDDYLEHLFK